MSALELSLTQRVHCIAEITKTIHVDSAEYKAELDSSDDEMDAAKSLLDSQKTLVVSTDFDVHEVTYIHEESVSDADNVDVNLISAANNYYIIDTSQESAEYEAACVADDLQSVLKQALTLMPLDTKMKCLGQLINTMSEFVPENAVPSEMAEAFSD